MDAFQESAKRVPRRSSHEAPTRQNTIPRTSLSEPRSAQPVAILIVGGAAARAWSGSPPSVMSASAHPALLAAMNSLNGPWSSESAGSSGGASGAARCSAMAKSAISHPIPVAPGPNCSQNSGGISAVCSTVRSVPSPDGVRVASTQLMSPPYSQVTPMSRGLSQVTMPPLVRRATEVRRRRTSTVSTNFSVMG